MGGHSAEQGCPYLRAFREGSIRLNGFRLNRMMVPRFGDFRVCVDSAEWLVTRPSEGAQKVEISDLDRLGRMEDDSAGLRFPRILGKRIIRPSDGPLGRAATGGISGSQDDSAEWLVTRPSINVWDFGGQRRFGRVRDHSAERWLVRPRCWSLGRVTLPVVGFS